MINKEDCYTSVVHEYLRTWDLTTLVETNPSSMMLPIAQAAKKPDNHKVKNTGKIELGKCMS